MVECHAIPTAKSRMTGDKRMAFLAFSCCVVRGYTFVRYGFAMIWSVDLCIILYRISLHTQPAMMTRKLRIALFIIATRSQLVKSYFITLSVVDLGHAKALL